MNQQIATSQLHQKVTTIIRDIITTIQEASFIAWLLLEKLYNKRREDLISYGHVEYNDEIEKQLFVWLDELKANKPLQYILGDVPFLDLNLIVRPPVLIPRPETEEWCAFLIQQLEPYKHTSLSILDLCTGSGCIALGLAKALPSSKIIGVDISEQALALSRENAFKNTILNASFIHSDLFDAIKQTTFDLIVANPPYISQDEWLSLDKNVKDWEDKQALVADHEGLSIIETIIQKAHPYLQKSTISIPTLWIEIGAYQGEKVVELFKKYDYGNVEVLKDYQDHDRVVMGTPHKK